ncbi:hypothetical protein AB0442_08690 [Kitasatospora sp. NPDC085895]|uniref:hypothetical protein n=1 Tax=Kitasatospora sp. NPDC085895 TaxID=3155057 RepID=UPI00344F69F0
MPVKAPAPFTAHHGPPALRVADFEDRQARARAAPATPVPRDDPEVEAVRSP